MSMNNKTETLLSLLDEYKALGIAEQIDYNKFYLYSLITHSTAIEGSTVTEIENQLLFDEGITAKGRSLQEQMMNLDLKAAYEQSMKLAKVHADFSVDMLKGLSALVMKNTGGEYNTASGSFDSSRKIGISAAFRRCRRKFLYEFPESSCQIGGVLPIYKQSAKGTAEYRRCNLQI